MPAPKRLTDLTNYAAVLPYASEMFGIYQPLLGWNSKRQAERFSSGLATDRHLALERMAALFAGRAEVSARDEQPVVELEPGVAAGAAPRRFESELLKTLTEELPEEPPKASSWGELLSPSAVRGTLHEKVAPAYAERIEAAGLNQRRELRRSGAMDFAGTPQSAAIAEQLRLESSLAGMHSAMRLSRR